MPASLMRRPGVSFDGGCSLLTVAKLGSLACAALMLVACGGEKDSGSADLTKGLAGVIGAGTMKALAASTATQGGVLINEVHAANWKGDVDEDGDAEDWLELYNPANSEVDLSGYGLTTNTRSPFRWVFPSGQKIGPRGYVRVWLSKKNRATLGQPLHASFNLDNGSDTVYLSASNATETGILVDSTKPALVKPDMSWCRLPSGVAASAFQICTRPTALAANAGPGFATMLAKPTFSVPSGLYAVAQTVTITGPAGATLRYTTDGSMPTEASPVYTEPVRVAASQALRAAAFGASALSSPAESNSYVIDAALAQRYAGLRIAFAVMAPADLARFQARDEALETLVHLEMFNGGTQLIKQDAAGSVAGNLGSVNSPQVSLNANAKDVFGPKDFESAGVLWPSKPSVTKTKKLRLRNGGNDWDQARLRDALAQDIASVGPNIVGASAPAVMFMNGRYYGHMNLREREDETSVVDNLSADKDYVDFLENPPGLQIKNGGLAALNGYRRTNDFILNNDMSFPANFERAKREVDLTSLAWDWGHHLLMANWDWPHNNVYVFRSPELGNRWTWRPHDFDFAFGRYAGPERNMNDSYSAVNSQMFTGLMRNREFSNLFFNVAADQMNLMTPTFMNSRLDAFVSDLGPYVNDVFVANGLGGEAGWNTQLAGIRNWIKLREPFHDQHLRDQFNLGNRGAIGVTINDRSMGTVKVNTLDVGAQMGGTNAWSGKYYPGIPISLEAQPKPGFVFAGWRNASTSSSRTISHTIAPTAALPADAFAVRWSGQLMAPATGSYRFQVIADDGVSLNINGQILLNSFSPRAETTSTTSTLSLVAGQRYPITVQYADFGGAATVRLMWLPPGANEYVPVPATQLYPDAAAPAPTGLFGAYFSNTDFAGAPVATAVENIDFVWGLRAPTPSRVEFEAVFAAGPTPAAPSIAPLAAQSARTGDLVNLPVSATDPNGHPLKYSASGLPRGVGIHPATGIIFGRITTPGTYNAVVTVSNGPSKATLPVTWTVTDRPGTGALGTSADSGTGPGNAPPAVSLTSPSSAQSLALGDSLTLAASASDADGSVAKVDFLDGGTLIGTATAAPYSLRWTPNTAGSRSLTAVATDNLGATTASAAVSVTVTTQANVPPASAVACATEGNFCAVPAGRTATVYFGGAGRFAVRTGVTGSVACSSAVFGDPVQGVSRSCSYVLTDAPVAGTSGVLTTQYWANRNLTGAPAATAQTLPSLNLQAAQAPRAGLPTSNFSVRWAGSLTPAQSGLHRFALRTSSGDGVRLWVNGALLADTWNAPQTALEAHVDLIGGRPVPIRVEFYDVSGPAALALTWRQPSDASFSNIPAARFSTASPEGAATGLRGEYFSGTSLGVQPSLVRIEAINFDWSMGAPAQTLPADNFSVRWTGFLVAPANGTYVFQTVSDDGVRLWVNGQNIINNWSEHSRATDTSVTLTLQAGQRVPVRLEYFERGGFSEIRWLWRTPGSSSYVAVPISALRPN